MQLNQTTSLKAGDYIATWWVDKDGKFNNHMFEDLWTAPEKYANTGRVQFTTKVLAVADGGRRLTIERRLPYNIRADMVEVSEPAHKICWHVQLAPERRPRQAGRRLTHAARCCGGMLLTAC